MMNPWVIAAMIPAMVILMVHFAIGPFGHPSRLHWHLKWKARPASLRQPLILLATLVLLAGATHVTGFWLWPSAPASTPVTP
ncbi:hypothetical protein ACQUQU_01200 [Thalassolituus sp. LLYu03]|uniref:hypothetical protein n=1 Tax=Thalassolituus sp. LLYu03 TaxID=3421656 RepID=UPI003D2997CE